MQAVQGTDKMRFDFIGQWVALSTTESPEDPLDHHAFSFFNRGLSRAHDFHDAVAFLK